MRIAFDLRRIVNPGIGRYMKCLVEAILQEGPQHEYLLVLPPAGDIEVPAGSKNVRRVVSRLKYYSIQEQLGLPFLLRRFGADVLHAPHIMVPLARTCPVVVTLHDVIPFTCDLPDPPSWLGRVYFRGMTRIAARLSVCVITDSEHSKKDIVHYLGTERDKIEVIYPAPDPRFQPVHESQALDQVRRKYGLPSDFVLYTGIYKPRKNHGGLLQAFRKLIDMGVTTNLVIAGPMKQGEKLLRDAAAELGIADKVFFPGFVHDPDLPALYSAARVYACPSLYEGFGFTLLEAMSCGTPVVSSPETSLAEVGGEAALFADPRDPDAFGSALARVLTDPDLRARMVKAGYENVRRFSWNATARATLAVYTHAFAAPFRRTASVST